jgi:porin
MRRIIRDITLSCMALASAMVLVPIDSGRAQASDGAAGPSSQPLQPTPTQAVDPPAVEHLFGAWGGPFGTLASLGVNFQLDAVSELAGNVTGGTRQGATFANQVGLGIDINWERLAGATGFSTHAIFVNRSGSSDSNLFGDHLLPVQEIYGSGGDVGVHLVSVYGEETLLNGRFDLAAGRMNVENDFASSPLYCNFMTNALCGDPKALPAGDIGHSAYPESVWATRLRVKPTPQTYIETGVYEVNQGLYTTEYDRTGFEFNTSRDSGVYIPVEIEWEPTLGPGNLPGHYKIGVGYDTSPGYKDFSNVLAAASAPGYVASERRGNTQLWGLVDQMFQRNGPRDDQGVIMLAGFVRNESTRTAYADQYYAGILDKGFWRLRPDDSVNLLFTYVSISPQLIAVQNVEQQYGLPLSDNATAVQSHEAILEVNYGIHLMRGITLRPDFQYVIRPNAQTSIRDAAVFGCSTHITF